MINKIAKLSDIERKAIFLEATSQQNIRLEMIEKDFWVCWVLNRIFSDEKLSKILCFKGGTSLSKVFRLIERFSEDIDLILDWNTVSNGLEIIKESKNQQDKRNKEILFQSQVYIATILKKEIENVVGDICKVEIDEDDPNSLQVVYPQIASSPYLRPFIKLEIGPLAAWMPNEIYPIKPYIDGISDKIAIDNIMIPTITAQRTFWEKATILHKEYYRTKGTPDRYSRHYYDLYKIANSDLKSSIFAQKDLLADVVKFKETFYSSGWANYDKAVIGSLKLIPQTDMIKSLKDDYAKMENMIFGDYPSFDVIISYLNDLEKEINNL